MKANLAILVFGVATIIVLLASGIIIYQRTNCPTSFEYRVCLVQGSRVTFVNGAWQGRKAIEPADPETSMDSCPEKWEYLTTAGADGWELVAVAPLTHLQDQHAQELYLRRAKR